MNGVYKRWAGAAVSVRVAVVALVLACLVPYRMEAHTSVATSGGTDAPPAGLSAADWAAIQARLTQAGAHVPLMTSEVAKLTAAAAAAKDHFGYAVAVSGDTVVVGARNGGGSGSAYVFGRNYDPSNPGTPLADNWGQRRKLTASDAALGDGFGYSVGISGDMVVVGAPWDDDGSDRSGSAYVFERNQDGPDNWGQVQKLTAADAAVQDYFGSSVAISGDTVVVGAWADDDGGESSGSAYVFERNYDPGNPGTPLADNWGQRQKLTAADAEEDDEFGTSVAVSGDTVVVGVELDDDGGTDSGSAYVFGRNYDPGDPGTPLADNWGQVRKLTAADAAAYDWFGCSVAISGDTVVVGALGHGISGVAYVFERNYDPGDPGTPLVDNWGQVRELTGALFSDHFGCAVAISGDTVVVGVDWDDDAGSGSGSAYLFERNYDPSNPGTPLADNWGRVAKLTASDAAVLDEFGESVAISGNTVVVGAPYDDDACPTDPDCDSGSAYVFARRGAAWAQQQKPVAGDAAAYDYFGHAVAISGDTFIGGATDNDDSGSAYLFYRNNDGADRWGQVRKRPNSLLTGGANFGLSVAIDGDAAVVGAPGADQAYIFERNDDGADLWGHVKTLSGPGLSSFGTSVSISGDTVVVGAPFDDTSCSGCGAVYVYERNQGGADNWGQWAVLTTHYAAGGDQFGHSVAISGDTVVVGAPHTTHNGKSNAGSAYVFKRNYDWDHPATPKADNWGEVVRFPWVDDAETGDKFGWSVAISGDTFVVGAPGDDDACPTNPDCNSGSVYVFERNHDWNDAWGRVEKRTADDAAGGDQFGSSVSISGDTVVVGAYGGDGGTSESGSAYVFMRNQGGADNWGQVQKLTASDAAAGDAFGYAVAISGNTIVVGASYDDDGGDASGSAYVFGWGAAEVYLPFVLKDSP